MMRYSGGAMAPRENSPRKEGSQPGREAKGGRTGATAPARAGERKENQASALDEVPVQIPFIFQRIDRSIARFIDPLGNLLVDLFHYAALFAIGAVTVWATLAEFVRLMEIGHVSVGDLLLLFIYLEVGAMVGIYFRTSRMPVRFLVYVAITALTRLLIGEVGKLEAGEGGDAQQLMWIAGAALVLAVALLLLRYGSSRFPSPPSDYQSQLRTGRFSARRPRPEDSE